MCSELPGKGIIENTSNILDPDAPAGTILPSGVMTQPLGAVESPLLVGDGAPDPPPDDPLLAFPEPAVGVTLGWPPEPRFPLTEPPTAWIDCQDPVVSPYLYWAPVE